MTIYYDFAGAVDRVKERLAEGQTPRRAVADRRRQVLMNRESRKTDTLPRNFLWIGLMQTLLSVESESHELNKIKAKALMRWNLKKELLG